MAIRLPVIISLILCGLVIDTPSAKSCPLKPATARQCSQE
jgi:hypothetical protein